MQFYFSTLHFQSNLVPVSTAGPQHPIDYIWPTNRESGEAKKSKRGVGGISSPLRPLYHLARAQTLRVGKQKTFGEHFALFSLRCARVCYFFSSPFLAL